VSDEDRVDRADGHPVGCVSVPSDDQFRDELTPLIRMNGRTEVSPNQGVAPGGWLTSDRRYWRSPSIGRTTAIERDRGVQRNGGVGALRGGVLSTVVTWLGARTIVDDQFEGSPLVDRR
jgi:hypothetical protein